MQPSVMQLLKGLYHLLLLICIVWVVIFNGAVASILHPPSSIQTACILGACQTVVCLTFVRLKQVTFSAPTGAGAVHMPIIATQTLEILVSSAAMMRVRMGMVMAVRIAGCVVQAVRVAATVAHLARISHRISLIVNCWTELIVVVVSIYYFLCKYSCSCCRPSAWLPLAELISGQRFDFQLALG